MPQRPRIHRIVTTALRKQHTPVGVEPSAADALETAADDVWRDMPPACGECLYRHGHAPECSKKAAYLDSLTAGAKMTPGDDAALDAYLDADVHFMDDVDVEDDPLDPSDYAAAAAAEDDDTGAKLEGEHDAAGAGLTLARPAAQLVLPGKPTPTGLVLPDDLTFQDWEQVGEVLQRMSGSIMWWVGDWLNYGHRKYGETYAQAVTATGYAVETVRQAAWVADRVETVTRRNGLSWSVHRAVAALDTAAQVHWLDKAEAEGWTEQELRRAVRAKPAPMIESVDLGQTGRDRPADVAAVASEIASLRRFANLYLGRVAGDYGDDVIREALGQFRDADDLEGALRLTKRFAAKAIQFLEARQPERQGSALVAPPQRARLSA